MEDSVSVQSVNTPQADGDLRPRRKGMSKFSERLWRSTLQRRRAKPCLISLEIIRWSLRLSLVPTLTHTHKHTALGYCQQSILDRYNCAVTPWLHAGEQEPNPATEQSQQRNTSPPSSVGGQHCDAWGWWQKTQYEPEAAASLWRWWVVAWKAASVKRKERDCSCPLTKLTD